jgi:general secretion pathway protein D
MAPPWRWRLLILALLLLLSAHDGHSKVRHNAIPASAMLNFPAADVDALARVMSEIIGKPIAVDPRVSGKLTLYTETPVTPAQAYALFQSGLRGLGFALVDSGGLIKVVPEAEGKLQAGTVVTKPGPALPDQILTQVFKLNHENASNIVASLRPLISPNNTINVNPGTNSLIVTDYASNLQRLQTLIAALDTPNATDVEVIPLQHALAADLASTVQKLTDGAVAAGGGATAGAAGPGTSILADGHLNALLVKAPNQARLAAVRSLVARLDQPGASGAEGSNIHVIYLKHAEATRLCCARRSRWRAGAWPARTAARVARVQQAVAPVAHRAMAHLPRPRPACLVVQAAVPRVKPAPKPPTRCRPRLRQSRAASSRPTRPATR